MEAYLITKGITDREVAQFESQTRRSVDGGDSSEPEEQNDSIECQY